MHCTWLVATTLWPTFKISARDWAEQFGMTQVLIILGKLSLQWYKATKKINMQRPNDADGIPYKTLPTQSGYFKKLGIEDNFNSPIVEL